MRLWYGKPVPFIKAQVGFTNMLEQNIVAMARPGTTIDVNWLHDGYFQPTYTYTEGYNAIENVKCFYEAWKKGYDGVIVGCAHDPGILEARSIIDIPIAGVFESAVLFATTLGHKYSIITDHRASKALQYDKIRRYGLSEKLASIRCIDVTPTQMSQDYASKPEELIEITRNVAKKAIYEDDAEVLVPGCTVLAALCTQEKVYEIDGVPIVDPVFAGIKMAENMVDMKKMFGIGVCRRSIYSAPEGWEKQIPIYMN